MRYDDDGSYEYYSYSGSYSEEPSPKDAKSADAKTLDAHSGQDQAVRSGSPAHRVDLSDVDSPEEAAPSAPDFVGEKEKEKEDQNQERDERAKKAPRGHEESEVKKQSDGGAEKGVNNRNQKNTVAGVRCSVCNKWVKDEAGLSMHQRSSVRCASWRGEDSREPCPKCGKYIAKGRWSLEQHLQNGCRAAAKEAEAQPARPRSRSPLRRARGNNMTKTPPVLVPAKAKTHVDKEPEPMDIDNEKADRVAGKIGQGQIGGDPSHHHADKDFDKDYDKGNEVKGNSYNDKKGAYGYHDHDYDYDKDKGEKDKDWNGNYGTNKWTYHKKGDFEEGQDEYQQGSWKSHSGFLQHGAVESVETVQVHSMSMAPWRRQPRMSMAHSMTMMQPGPAHGHGGAGSASAARLSAFFGSLSDMLDPYSH